MIFKKGHIGLKAEKHPYWKGGRSPQFYREFAFKHLGKSCMLCNSGRNLTIHHKDKNRNNNLLENLTVVCRSCHQKIHNVVVNFKESYKTLKRDKGGRFIAKMY